MIATATMSGDLSHYLQILFGSQSDSGRMQRTAAEDYRYADLSFAVCPPRLDAEVAEQALAFLTLRRGLRLLFLPFTQLVVLFP